MKTWVLLALCLSAVLAERKRYDGYQVLEFVVASKEERPVLDRLRDDEELDFWTSTPMYGQPIQVMVPPHRVPDIIDQLNQANIDFDVTRENVQERLDAEWERLKEKRDFDINDYNTLEDIYGELYAMVERCPSTVSCEVYNMGNSVEGREILVFRMYKSGSERRAYWFDSTIHAREWLSTATNLMVLDHMINNYDLDAEVTYLLDTYDFYFAPVMNPDGYLYSWDVDRMWRKNRAENQGSTCVGVDLNRNFDYYWGNAGSSTDPCSNTYMGPEAASEVETQLTQNEANRLANVMDCWTSIHTSGQIWLHPWGWEDEDGQCARAEDHDDMYQVAEVTCQAIMETHDTVWTYGTICEAIYPASGGTIDYVKGVSGTKYTYTPELRGDGFDPPASEIVPSFEEVWNGIVAMVAEIERIGN